ncbi:M1 family metallopeptidase [Rurimicrobium arvi]|uniref:Peptidase M1 membrane alanine aminopeptidase domain-containing protein n=1 Tax=Rurimicrobium arvi TaxID=2049916 RepID=A0ABP8MNG9_9BACT
MSRFLLWACIALTALPAAAQHAAGTASAAPFQNDPLYWKNRQPVAGYWQQDVHYSINARIDESDNRIDATQQLEYWNNSPDTLKYVYFHLYQNAFIKGSHLHELEKANKGILRLGKKEAEGKGIVIERIAGLSGQALRTELDNTIMKVYLEVPLLPGQKTSFAIQFSTYYDKGATRRRMQMYDAWGFMHYNGVQWYPKICVYDRKFGWDTYQHLNKEFYGDFGSFDVSLDFPSNYVVEATGAIQNRDEVLPKELREKLDVKNFAKKPWNEAPSEITPYVKGERKTWKFHADNVHDFAFTADPSYRINTTYWNGIECVGLVQEPHASGWQTSAEYVAKIIKTFSEDFGPYAYPKMIAADANDGMEYPMLTMDGGSAPGYNGLLIHEIGHNWFYGMVGSNETYRAAMDEGFTQFLTAWGINRIDGRMTPASKKGWRGHFSEPTDMIDRSVFNAYHYDALNQEETPLNTHSDDFNSALGHGGGYRLVYYKTASMLYNLQYVLGDSLFSETMKHYFAQWKIAHPYFEDFKASVIGFTHVDLNWFFDEWFETTKTADYAIGRIRHTDGKDNYDITFKRKGEMQMPVDFTVTAKDGQQYSYTIPNTWFTKETSATPLPKWYGWAKLHPDYTASVNIPGGIRHVQIDTSNRLVDINMLNNYKTRGILPFSTRAVRVKLDGGINTPTDRKHYRMFVRPDVWWNAVDGVKAGLHFEGDYFATLHQVDASVWVNTHAGQLDKYLVYTNQGWYDHYAPVNYTFNYSTPFCISHPKVLLNINSRFLDGLWLHRIGGSISSGANLFELYGQTMWRPLSYDRDYLLYTHEWSSRRALPNSSVNAAVTHQYNGRYGGGSVKLSARAPFLTGNNSQSFNYAYAQLEIKDTKRIGKLELRTRIFGRYGTGTNIPYESALFAAGANPEEMMENKYTRSVGLSPTEWTGDMSGYNTNHFQYGGGLNLRGYAGYLMADERNGNVLLAYKGRSGAAVNAELKFSDYLNLRPKFTRKWLSAAMYLFADAGVMELSRYDSLSSYWNIRPSGMVSDIRVDAGIGAAFTIRRWFGLDKPKPLTLRFDMPLFLNRPPYANPQYFTARYVVGINRAF